MKLKLYGHDTSPYVYRIRLLLAELGIPFDRDVNGWMSDPSPEFLAQSPIKRLPMLDRGPAAKVRYVYDSRVIASVLYASSDKAPGNDVQPTLFAPELAELDQNILSALDAGLDSAINLFLMERDGAKKEDFPYLQRQAARVEECLDWVSKQYDGRTTLTPGRFAFVEIAVAAMMQWLRFRNRVDVTRWPNLLAVESAARRRSAIATIPLG